MAKRQFITLRTPKSNEETDMEVPSDRPVSEILPEILKILNWPFADENGNPLYYVLTDSAGRKISPEMSFNAANIDNFSIVHVALDEVQRLKVLEAQQSAPSERIPGKGNGSENGELLSQPVPFVLPIDGPCLIYGSTIYMLDNFPALIGRKGKNSTPEIDLSDIDNRLISSHRHAEIIREGSGYVLHTLTPKNGMLLNGSLQDTDSSTILKNGDVLGFGFKGIQMTWREPVR